jgi:hypothetical protein
MLNQKEMRTYTPRKTKAKIDDRECLKCKRVYTPTSSCQKYCCQCKKKKASERTAEWQKKVSREKQHKRPLAPKGSLQPFTSMMDNQTIGDFIISTTIYRLKRGIWIDQETLRNQIIFLANKLGSLDKVEKAFQV